MVLIQPMGYPASSAIVEREPMPATPAIPGQGRPLPPPELTERERHIWTACVESRPLNYFDPGTWPLLKAYAMHAVLAEDRAAELRKHSTDKLRREHRQQTAMLANLATRLRLTKLGQRRDQRSDYAEVPSAACGWSSRATTRHSPRYIRPGRGKKNQEPGSFSAARFFDIGR